MRVFSTHKTEKAQFATQLKTPYLISTSSSIYGVCSHLISARLVRGINKAQFGLNIKGTLTTTYNLSFIHSFQLLVSIGATISPPALPRQLVINSSGTDISWEHHL